MPPYLFVVSPVSVFAKNDSGALNHNVGSGIEVSGSKGLKGLPEDRF